MVKKKHHIGYIIVAVFLVIIIGIAIWLCRCLTLAFQDDYKDKYTLSETDDTLVLTMLKGSVFGNDFQITEVQFNTYINEKLCSDNNNDDNGIENIAVYFHEDSPAEIYAKIKLYGYEFGFYSDVTFTLDTSTDTITAILSNAKLGNLDIPDNLLAKALSKALENKNDISVSETAVSCKASYEYEIKNQTITLILEELIPHEGYISCRTNSLSQETINALKDYITSDEGKQELAEFFKNSVGEIKDNITSWIKEYQSR